MPTVSLTARGIPFPSTGQDRLNERLLTACQQHDPVLVEDLLSQGAQANARHVGLAAFAHRLTPLLAVFQGLDAMAQFHRGSVSQDPKVQALREQGVAQHRTVRTLLDRLLAAGADPDQASPVGDRPLDLAAHSSRWDLVERLLDVGADPRRNEGASIAGVRPLLLAALDGQTALVHRLVGLGCSLDQGTGRTLLHHLLDRNDQDLRAPWLPAMVRTLVALGVDPDAEADLPRGQIRRVTALLLASSVDDPATMRALTVALLESGARVDPTSDLQVHVLYDRQKPVHHWTESCWTPLANAIQANRADVIDLLVEHGADLGRRLHHTVAPSTVVRAMLDAGQILPEAEGPGLTPVELAWACGHGELAQRLEQRALTQGFDTALGMARPGESPPRPGSRRRL